MKIENDSSSTRNRMTTRVMDVLWTGIFLGELLISRARFRFSQQLVDFEDAHSTLLAVRNLPENGCRNTQFVNSSVATPES